MFAADERDGRLLADYRSCEKAAFLTHPDEAHYRIIGRSLGAAIP
jgi:hypothetical protein